ncbi:MAG: hypothetical protein H7A23_20290 [Leptospiraceae bacterium]|nr:hypothetical protein [Leptospiraceae bacterium]
MGGSKQGCSLNLTGAVTTLAGTAGTSGATDGTGTAAQFFEPSGITTDGTNLYVADRYNDTIRKITISTGVVTTLVGTVGIRGATDGTGTAAQFNLPEGITTDGTNLYVADSWNYTIRKVVISSGAVTTLAGTVGTGGSVDGTGTAAQFNLPYGITTDGTNLYVTDLFSNTIRKVEISTGVVTTLAGTAGIRGSTDGTGTAAQFDYPSGITTDGTNLYVADYYNCTIRKVVISSGVVTTLVGTVGTCGSTDGTGTAAQFNFPESVTTDGINLYVTDYYGYTIRKIEVTSGIVTTLAGKAGKLGTTDGTGTIARFNSPYGITTNGTNLYVTDYFSHTIRQIK